MSPHPSPAQPAPQEEPVSPESSPSGQVGGISGFPDMDWPQWKRVMDGEALVLEPGVLEHLEQGRRALLDYISQGWPTYGVTTGFGDNCHNQIPESRSRELQKSLLEFHGIGLGPVLEPRESRAVLLCRTVGLLRGASAIRPVLAQRLVALLNGNCAPVIPSLGSVGASGDLTPLSYLAALVTGRREAWLGERRIPASQALAELGLEPLELEAKEALALMNGTSVMTALGLELLADLDRFLLRAEGLSAWGLEVLRGSELPFRPFVHQMKAHPGQVATASRILSILQSSGRIEAYEQRLARLEEASPEGTRTLDWKIQDRYSFRCAPQVLGVLRDTRDWAAGVLLRELNSSNDNPLMDPQSGVLYNGGNFYGGHVAAALDYLRIALAECADLLDKQVQILLDGKFNGLTENLVHPLSPQDPRAGLRHGLKAAGISTSALSAEVQFLAAPLGIHSRPTESLNQDRVSLGTISARKSREQMNLANYLVALHGLVLAQAMDVAGPQDFSPWARRCHDWIRMISPRLEEDRALDREAEQLALELGHGTSPLEDTP